MYKGILFSKRETKKKKVLFYEDTENNVSESQCMSERNHQSIDQLIQLFFDRVQGCLKNGYEDYSKEKKEAVWQDFTHQFDVLLEKIRSDIDRQKKVHARVLREKQIREEKRQSKKLPSHYPPEAWAEWNLRNQAPGK